MRGHTDSQNPSDGWPCFVACASTRNSRLDGALVWVTGGFFGDVGDAMVLSSSALLRGKLGCGHDCDSAAACLWKPNKICSSQLACSCG